MTVRGDSGGLVFMRRRQKRGRIGARGVGRVNNELAIDAELNLLPLLATSIALPLVRRLLPLWLDGAPIR